MTAVLSFFAVCREKQKHEATDGNRQTKQGNANVGNLHDEPAGDHIEKRHPKDVATLEFGNY